LQHSPFFVLPSFIGFPARETALLHPMTPRGNAAAQAKSARRFL
jgi:hypothetical protein